MCCRGKKKIINVLNLCNLSFVHRLTEHQQILVKVK